MSSMILGERVVRRDVTDGRRVWKYQRGNQNPYFEEEQTTQWAKEKVQKYKIGICCFPAKHTALRRKSKDWSARNQNNVSEWSDMSTRGL
jgi:hypothetical protein